MAFFTRGDVNIHYQEYGSGFPILLIAPGGMRSEMTFWERTPWNPIEQLSPKYRVIAMDQRNAGQSTAPITATDNWPVYTSDQLALMDHLGIDRFHVAGMCIGGSYIMALSQATPQRVASGVVFQTIGLDGNRQAFYDMFDSWADELRPQRPDVDPGAWAPFRDAMYGTDSLFTCTREEAAACPTPLLVLLGDDLYHPEASSRDLAALAPHATLVEHWKEPEHHASAIAAIDRFLAQHSG